MLAGSVLRLITFRYLGKFFKFEASIQKDQVRVVSPSRDDLQTAIAQLKAQDFGLALTFGNYR